MSDNTVGHIIDFAIEEEQAAAALYTATADKIKEAAAREMLLEMARMEAGHEAKLKAFKAGKIDSINTIKAPDLKISDYLIEKDIDENSSLQEVMIFAMKAEQKANALYTRLSDLCQDENEKALFAALADEELKHKNDLERSYEDNFSPEN